MVEWLSRVNTKMKFGFYVRHGICLSANQTRFLKEALLLVILTGYRRTVIKIRQTQFWIAIITQALESAVTSTEEQGIT